MKRYTYANKDDDFFEKRIAIGAIVSEPLLMCLCDERFFKWEYIASEAIQTVIEWCLDYYEDNGKPPKDRIQDIFEDEADNNDSTELKRISRLLDRASKEYERDEHNDALFVSSAEQYFRSRREVIVNEIKAEMIAERESADKIAAIDEQYPIPTVTQINTQSIFRDKEYLFDILDNERNRPLFTIPGMMGKLFEDSLVRQGFIAFLGDEKVGKCISGDSLVSFADGRLISIEEVVRKRIKGKVLSYNEETKRIQPCDIAEYHNNGIKDCWKLVTKSGKTVTTTENHQYLTPDGWKYLRELKEGDYVAMPKHTHQWGKQKRDYNLVKWIAYMLAEGCTVANETSCAAQFTNKDSSVCDDFMRVCDSLGIGYKQNNNAFELSGNARKLIREHGLYGHSAKTKEIPNWIFTQPKYHIASFLRVFFTCDGWVTDREIGIALANEKMIRQISHLLIRFGIVFRIRKRINREGFECYEISIKSSEHKNLFIDHIGFNSPKNEYRGYSDSKKSFIDKFPWQEAERFYNELKEEYPKGKFYKCFGRDKAHSIRQEIRNHNPIMRQSFSNAFRSRVYDKYINSDVFWDQVSYLSFAGKKPTYDLTVKDHHNYIANDCLVHNSWLLLYLAVMAAKGKLNVLFVSAGDMSKENVDVRLAISLTKRSNKAKYCMEHYEPCMDCQHNQRGTCPYCQAKVPSLIIKDDSGERLAERPEEASEDYETHHKDSPDLHGDGCEDFIPTTWFRKVPACTPLSEDREGAWKELQNVRRMIKKRGLEVEFAPTATLTVEDLEAMLRRYESNGTIMDVVVVDYADIMADEKVGYGEARHVHSTRWKKLRRFAQVNELLLVTATQSNRREGGGLKGRNDISEDKSKMAEVTAFFGINQTKKDKRFKRIALNQFAGRDGDYDEECVVWLLQNLQRGQVNIDSYFGWWHD